MIQKFQGMPRWMKIVGLLLIVLVPAGFLLAVILHGVRSQSKKK